jgi:DNA-binding NtrC family response regulator
MTWEENTQGVVSRCQPSISPDPLLPGHGVKIAIQLPMDRVLYVDDDHLVRNVLLRTLRRRGIPVDVADGAAEAVSLAGRQDYAVVITDYTMPGVNGLRLIEQIRCLAPYAAFVLVSGRTDLNRLPLGAHTRTLAKPWSLEQLLAELERGVRDFRNRRAAANRLLKKSEVGSMSQVREEAEP